MRKRTFAIVALLLTVIITAAFTLMGMVLTVFAAYPLTKKELKGRGAIAFMFMFTMYFSGGLIPDFLLMNDLGIFNTLWSLVLPLAFSAYNIIIMRSFIEASIPVSLEEAAFLDGASYWGVLFRVVIPLSKPVLATVALWVIVGHWNDYLNPLVLISSRANQTLQLQLKSLVLAAESSTSNLSTLSQTTDHKGVAALSTQVKNAVLVVSMIPMLVIYPFIQRFFVSGVMLGSVKG